IPRSTLYSLFTQAPAIIAVLRGRDLVFDLVNPAYQQLFPGRSLVGRPVREALPELEGQGSLQRLERVFQTGQPYTSRETRLMLDRETFFNVTYQPMYSDDATVEGVIVFAFDVTAEVRARREGDEMFHLLVDSLRDYAIFMLDPNDYVTTWTEG